MVPPQPLSKVPQAFDPTPGPVGTFAQVYGAPSPFAQTQVPSAPGVLVEQTWPVPHPHEIVPPMPLSSPIPHFPLYALLHVSGVLQRPGPSALVHGWSLHQQVSPFRHVQTLSDPQPGVTGVFVMLHSALWPPLPVHAGAGVQHTPLLHVVPPLQLLLQLMGDGAVRHEFWVGAHEPASCCWQLSVRVQHEPTVPLGGAAPGCPFRLSTQTPPLAQMALMLFSPQPFGRFVPHWAWLV
jgi:hypothetical protein